MSKITERYERLVPTDVFVTSGMLDDQRVDKTMGAPFVAIDPQGAKEIDDAIRFTPQTNGFKLEVAVADGVQIDPESSHFKQALKLGRSVYDIRGRDYLIFNDSVLEELSLRGAGKRAIVAAQVFDYNAIPKSNVVIEPAWINAINFEYGQTPTEYIQAMRDSRLAIESLSKKVFSDDNHFENFARGGKAVGIDEKFVTTSMVWSNQVMSRWFDKREIPIPKRVYQGENPFRAGDGNNERLISGHYSHRRKGHEVFPRDYTHFTSPLRRAADLIVHQQWASQMTTGTPRYSKKEIKRLSRKITLKQFTRSDLEAA